MFRTTAALAGPALLALVLLPPAATAQDSLFQLSLLGPTLQMVDDDQDIRGLRLNLLYGVNRNVSGVDFGLVNHTNGVMTGVGFGLANVVDEDFAGWQAGLLNVAPGRFTGLQWSAWTGASLVNTAGQGEGAQIAWGFNHAGSLRGFQLALVNVADDLYGVQVGIINIIRSKADCPVLPLVNWKFDE
jgi:hypothetical protein